MRVYAMFTFSLLFRLIHCPPLQEGYDMVKIAEAREKAAAKLLQTQKDVEGAIKGAKSILHAGKEAADLFGVKVPGSN